MKINALPKNDMRIEEALLHIVEELAIIRNPSLVSCLFLQFVRGVSRW